MQQKQQYKPSLGAKFFMKDLRVCDVFKNQEYVKEDFQTEQFHFGSDDFDIKQIYYHYYNKQDRYPIQAFFDVYFFSNLQEFTQTTMERERLRTKTKKISQLAQKLFNLTILEERLLARRNLLKENFVFEERKEKQKEVI